MMKHLIMLSAFLFFSCNNGQSPNSLPFSINLLNSSFSYDPTASSNFSKKPFASLRNDTLTICDYWALNQQPAYQSTMEIQDDTISIAYSPLPLSPVNDWNPTVETILQFSVQNIPSSLLFKFGTVNDARSPDSLELTQGIRNAKRVLIVKIYRDSLNA